MKAFFGYILMMGLMGTALLLNQCNTATGQTGDSASVSAVKEASISNLEAAVDAIETDCDATKTAWAAIYPEPIENYRYLALSPTLTTADEERIDAAIEALQSKIEECFPESQTVDTSELVSASESVTSQCEKLCPISALNCVYWGGVCLGGDNQACCFAGACGSDSHCLAVCENTSVCDVPTCPPDGGGGGE